MEQCKHRALSFVFFLFIWGHRWQWGRGSVNWQAVGEGILTWRALCTFKSVSRGRSYRGKCREQRFCDHLGISASDLVDCFILAPNDSLASIPPLSNHPWNHSNWNVALGSEFSSSHFQSGVILYADSNLFRIPRLISIWCSICYSRPNGSE